MTLFYAICFVCIANAALAALALNHDGVLSDSVEIERAHAIDRGHQSVRKVGDEHALKRITLNDTPDESRELKGAWDAWHRRVAAAIYQRYAVMAEAEFKDKKPFRAHASYTVAKDRRVVDARITQSSRSRKFDTVVLTAINSVNDSEILRFPIDAHQTYVIKSAAFAMDAGLQGDFGPHPGELGKTTHNDLAD